MVLVVGASGFLGREVVRQLLADGRRVRAATRTPDKLADLRSLGAEVVAADLIDPASLVSACQGAGAVLVAAHSLTGVGKYSSRFVDDAGHHSLIDAAKAARVERFVYTSAMFASSDHPVDFFRSKSRVERYLAASGLDFTILRPSALMEWHVHDLFGKSLVEEGKATIFGKGDNPTNFVAAADVAASAVHALADPGAAGKTWEIGGPDNLSKRQVADLYRQMLGRPVTLRRVPRRALAIMAPLLRPFQPVLSRLMTLALWADTANQTFDVRTMALQDARPMTRVSDFIATRVATCSQAVSRA